MKSSKILSIVLSFSLCFSLMGFPLLAAAENQNNSGESVVYAEDGVQNNTDGSDATGTTESAATQGSDSANLSSETSLQTEDQTYSKEVQELSAKEALSFVYIDNAVIAAGETEHVVLGFTDDTLKPESSVLSMKASNSTELKTLEGANQTEGAVLFSFETTDSDIASYELNEMTWTTKEGLSYKVSFTEEGSSCTFEVVSQELAATLEEASQVSDSEETVALTIDESGTLSAQASIEEALQVSGSGSDQELQADDTTSGEATLASASSAREDYLIVAIDPGHGGSDSGACGYGLEERSVNLSISQYLYNELSTYSGVTPYMTRTTDEYVGLQERVDRAVSHGADVFVCIHCNATGSGTAYGAEVWVPNDSSYLYEQTHVVGEELGYKIESQLVALGLYNRGVKTRDCTNYEYYPDGSLADYYTVIDASRRAGIPGIIVEHAFIDNESDASKLASDSFRQQLGVADATGIANQYNVLKDSSAQAQSTVKVQAHVSNLGWESAVYDQKVAGTTGKSFGLEAFNVSLQNGAAGSGGIEYRSAALNESWQDWASNGTNSGTTGQSKQLEQLEMKLTGEAANNYDVYYRVHVSNIGWLGWAKNGQTAGSLGFGYGIEAVEVVLVEKDGAAPGSTSNPFVGASNLLSYQAHVENIGWQSTVYSPAEAGTTGQALRVEALKASISNPEYSGDIQIATHVEDIGWQDYVSSGNIAGTEGQAKRLEAIKVQLTGEMANHFDVYYRVHAQDIGWMGWAKNGNPAGTAGYCYRLEAVQIQLVEKGGAAPGSTDDYYRDAGMTLSYQAHVENIGWQSTVYSPAEAGTTGQALRVEALKASISNPEYSGDIQIATHVEDIGWQDYVSSGNIAGTEGQAKRLEAIKVQLTGEMANHFDVYYRVHAQDIGWMGWAKNGSPAGTAGYAYRLEAVQIQLVEKGGAAPGSTDDCYRDKTQSYQIMGTTQTSVDQMVRRFNSTGNSYPSSVYTSKGAETINDFCQILYEEANAEGVRAEIVFAQAMHETGWLQFGGDVKAEQCNFAGLGATGNGVQGNSFSSVREGLRAQVQHLKAYASTDNLNQVCVDSRFNYVTRGCAPTLDDLTGRWATNPAYATLLKAQVDALLKS